MQANEHHNVSACIEVIMMWLAAAGALWTSETLRGSEGFTLAAAGGQCHDDASTISGVAAQ